MLAYCLGAILCLTALWILALATGWALPSDLLYQGINWLKTNQWESIVLAALLLLLGLLIFFRPREKIPRSFRASSKTGEVRIAYDALQEIVRQSALEIVGVLQVKVSLRENKTGLEITVTTQFNSDVVITEISEQIQLKVQKDVEHFTGIQVAEVKVLVQRPETAGQARVK
ncbi:MAG TPA: alkaline shock response membrane anchor protein AmaP [Desulfitobacteriaceae bacterium]|nr:alkaline shock response membrane anchor protein AmaP [Desulfitobacteriaceae bacterium]